MEKIEAIAAPNKTDEIRARNRKVLPLLQQECPELHDWLNDLSRFGGNLVDASVLSRENGGFRILLFTSLHVYCITTSQNYLGCIVSRRTARAGETWTMGNDLADGSYSRATWNSIITDILAYELVRLGKISK